MRIHELAKELGIESKTIKEKCLEHGIELPKKNYHLKALTDEQIALMRSALSPSGSQGEAQQAPIPSKHRILKLTQRHGHAPKKPADQPPATAVEPKAEQLSESPAVDTEKPVSTIPDEEQAKQIQKPEVGDSAEIEQVESHDSSSTTTVLPKEPEKEKPKEVEAEQPPKDVSSPEPPQPEVVKPSPVQTNAPSTPPEAKIEDESTSTKIPKKPSKPRLTIPPQKAKGYTPAHRSEHPKTTSGSHERPAELGRRRKSSGWYRKGQKFRRPAHTGILKPKREPSVVERAEIELPITIRELSAKFGRKVNDIISKAMKHERVIGINQSVDKETIELLAEEYNIKVDFKEKTDIEETLAEFDEWEDNPDDLQPRAPIVTFLGHVDHGKTSLLDQIRQTNVTESEAGGITQHIGAYKVKTLEGREVTFLDTPGHKAFTAMRARGANVTDVVVLVIAADDGVMPQTEEAIDHARAANVPIVVALNKIDKPDAKPERVKQELVGYGLTPEEWGGNIICVEVSAITGQGIKELVEMLSLEAEMLELKANPKRPAEGTVLEAEISEGRGTVATVLVQNGTLYKGDNVLCGTAYGRIRAIYDDRGRSIKEAGPATPVEIIGLSGVPEAGDKFYAFEDAQKAKEIALVRREKQREASLAVPQHVTLENLYEHIEREKSKELRTILRADVKGSLEVIKESLRSLSTDEVKLRILHSGIGGVNESDVLLADASDAVIIGFNVATEEKARHLAERCGVQIRFYDVIYQLTDDIKSAIEGMLQPEIREIISGHVEVRKIFRGSSIGSAAGCYVTDGKISRNSPVRLLRDNVVIYDGKIGSLRIEREDVHEVREGFECGIKIESYDDIKVGDVIEAYEIQQIARTLDST